MRFISFVHALATCRNTSCTQRSSGAYTLLSTETLKLWDVVGYLGCTDKSPASMGVVWAKGAPGGFGHS